MKDVDNKPIQKYSRVVFPEPHSGILKTGYVLRLLPKSVRILSQQKEYTKRPHNVAVIG